MVTCMGERVRLAMIGTWGPVPVKEEPAAPAHPPRRPPALNEAMARHPAGSRLTGPATVNDVLNACEVCPELGAELCDDCAQLVLLSTR